jgi:cellobiose phosphorylase
LLHRTPYGGFDPGGAFVIDLTPGLVTPAPWTNVIANERFSFLATERGGGYTWAGNSRENRLTPWSNDPVGDPAGEALYLRDEAGGMLWSLTPQPAGAGHIRVRHGFGVTTFEQQRHAIRSELRLSVPREDSVKLYRLILKNAGETPRRLSATLYVEWVLGVFRESMAPFIITELDPASGALLARNPYNPEFANHVAFLACSEQPAAVCGDRVAFIGRNGDLARPAALLASGLSGRVGAGFDPCGAIHGRTICGCRRCLRRSAAYRTRRMDMVHRFCRLDVSSGSRDDSRVAPCRKHPDYRTMHSAELAELRGMLPLRRDALPYSSNEPGRRCIRRCEHQT